MHICASIAAMMSASTPAGAPNVERWSRSKRRADCGDGIITVMSRVSTIKMTARQFLELGEDPPGVRLELVDGEIAVSPSPVPDHAYTVLALGSLLKVYVDENDLGMVLSDVDTIFGE